MTEKLLEAEDRKLKVLKAEIEAGKHSDAAAASSSKAKELELQENNYLRIRMQYQRLSQEMQDVAVAGLIQRKPKLKASRSLPAFGMKQVAKPRPSLFDYLVPRPSPYDSTSHTSTSVAGGSSGALLREGPVSNGGVASPLYTPGQHSQELVYKDGILVSGSLEALIELLVPTEHHYPEHSFVFAFILCSRLFLRPYELLARTSRLFHTLQKQFTATGKPVADGPAPKIVQLLSEWTEMFPYDFRDERMMRSLKDMTQTCISLTSDLRKAVGQVQSTLVRKLSILDKYEHVLAQVNSVAMERLIDPQTQVNILMVCESPMILAQQLTHIELERLNNIGPEEFIQTFVKVKSDTPLYRDMKKTSNIEAYVEWFNRLSYLVATEICVSDKKRNRAKVLEFFMDTAMECRRVNNFNSFMAISAGLFMSPVTRLKKTRAKVNSAKLQEIEALVDPVNNFSRYRQALALAITQAGQEEERRCVIPFFSLLIKDVYFLHEAMSDRLENGYIRFEKCMALARVVSQILDYKDTVLPFQRVRSVLNYLMTIPIHTDDELQLASYEVEPPDNSGERKRYQELRLLLGSFGQRIRRSGAGSQPTSPTSTSFPTIQEES